MTTLLPVKKEEIVSTRCPLLSVAIEKLQHDGKSVLEIGRSALAKAEKG
jgi:hypothetical protein